MLKKISLLILIATSVISVSCSDETRGQVVFTVSSITARSTPFGDILDSSGIIPTDEVDVILNNNLRNPSGLGSTTFTDVLVDSVTISFNRTDGGSDKPPTVKYAISARVVTNGSVLITSITLMPSTMKQQFPISDLLIYGFERSTNYTSIKLDATLEFTGKTVEGDPVFASGKISLELTNWAD